MLFVLDGLTFLAYVIVLHLRARAAAKPLERGETAGSYRKVLRDRLFLGLWTLNFLFVAAGYSLINLLPPFLRDNSHSTEREIGFVFFFSTITIVLVQLPMSRWLEGRRRLRALALMPFLWALAWLGVDRDRLLLVGTTAFVVTVVCAIAFFGVGECLHGPAHQALVGELGGDRLRGRYFALHSMSWGLGGAARPGDRRAILAAVRARPLVAGSASSPRRARSRSTAASLAARRGFRGERNRQPASSTVKPSRPRSAPRFGRGAGVGWRTCRWCPRPTTRSVPVPSLPRIRSARGSRNLQPQPLSSGASPSSSSAA